MKEVPCNQRQAVVAPIIILSLIVLARSEKGMSTVLVGGKGTEDRRQLHRVLGNDSVGEARPSDASGRSGGARGLDARARSLCFMPACPDASMTPHPRSS
jgi:hypothetical protein